MAYAAEHDIPIEMKRGKKSPFSMDANLLHISFEGGPLEDPWTEPPTEMWRWSVSPRWRPTRRPTSTSPTSGRHRRHRRQAMTPAEVLDRAQPSRRRQRRRPPRHRREPLRRHEDRGALRDPGRHDHAARPPRHRVDHARPRGGPPQGRADAALRQLIYNGFWWSPEREMLQVAIDHSQAAVNGEVRLKLYKGNVDRRRPQSTDSLFDEKIATFEEDEGAYDQADAEGFIKLNAAPAAQPGAKAERGVTTSTRSGTAGSRAARPRRSRRSTTACRSISACSARTSRARAPTSRCLRGRPAHRRRARLSARRARRGRAEIADGRSLRATTRTSTPRSSAGSPSSPPPGPRCTPAAAATIRSPPICVCGPRRARRGRRAVVRFQRTLLGPPRQRGDAYLPGYTHLQQAQPVALAHHLLAHGWALAATSTGCATPAPHRRLGPRRRRACRLVAAARSRADRRALGFAACSTTASTR